MPPIERPSSGSRFLLEVDGVTAIVATDATPPGYKHTPVKYQPGNEPRATHIRGNVEIEECTFKHAHAIGQIGQQLFQWLAAFGEGEFVETRNARLVVLDETGRTPVQTWEMTDCVPTMFKPEGMSGTNTDVAMFSFSLQPNNARLI